MILPRRSRRALALALALSASAALVAQTPAKKPELRIDKTPLADAKGPALSSYADVVAPVQKAVVSVYSTKIVRRPVNPLFRQFFGDQIPDREEGLGSGVIVSENGYILTNNHVVEGADELNVSLADEREFKAKVIGSDPKTDVAVIKIEAENLPTVTLADSDLSRVGDIVFAVGNPLGVGQTVTMGIISATSRRVGILDEAGYENFIQTDAAINQGNSGGALIDARGRLIGINSAILSTSRGNIGIGFAIPVNLAASIMHSLVETGTVTRGFLGVQVDPVNPELAEALGLGTGVRGVVVTATTPGGPAEKAGVERGDVILSVDDRAVTSPQDLRLLVSQLAPDKEVAVKVSREGKDRLFHVKLGRLADTSNELVPGVKVSRVTPELRRTLNLEPGLDGLVVTEVDPDSPHARRLLANMVILEINRHPARDVDTARQLLVQGRNLLAVWIGGRRQYLALPLE